MLSSVATHSLPMPLGTSLQVMRLLLGFGTGEEGVDKRGHAGLPAWEPVLLAWHPVPAVSRCHDHTVFITLA